MSGKALVPLHLPGPGAVRARPGGPNLPQEEGAPEPRSTDHTARPLSVDALVSAEHTCTAGVAPAARLLPPAPSTWYPLGAQDVTVHPAHPPCCLPRPSPRHTRTSGVRTSKVNVHFNKRIFGKLVKKHTNNTKPPPKPNKKGFCVISAVLRNWKEGVPSGHAAQRAVASEAEELLSETRCLVWQTVESLTPGTDLQRERDICFTK